MLSLNSVLCFSSRSGSGPEERTSVIRVMIYYKCIQTLYNVRNIYNIGTRIRNLSLSVIQYINDTPQLSRLCRKI